MMAQGDLRLWVSDDALGRYIDRDGVVSVKRSRGPG